MHAPANARGLSAALGLTVAMAAWCAAPGAARAATASTIVYQCGSAGQICAIAPAGGTPTTLAQGGTLAGVTRDGTTYGYLPSGGGIWEAPVAGGTPTEINTQSQMSPLAVMSPDGRYVLEQLMVVGVQYAIEYDVAAGPGSSYSTVDSTTGSMTYGWLGDTPITTHSQLGLDPPSWACLGQQTNGYCGQGATSPQIQSGTQNILFPDGSPDGSQVVAVLTAPGQSAGAIALFNATTGALIRTVATPPAGTGYSVPRFSPDGRQIVFESDPVDPDGTIGGPGAIDVVDVDGTGQRTIAQGTNPFWGGTATAPVTTTAPSISLRAARQRLAAVRRRRRLTVTCALGAAGRCAVTATVPARVARRLKLKVRRHARTATLARASHTFTAAGRAKLTLRLSRREARGLRRVRRVTLTLHGTSSAPGAKRMRTSTRRITLR
jgi:hypothetical protein